MGEEDSGTILGSALAALTGLFDGAGGGANRRKKLQEDFLVGVLASPFVSSPFITLFPSFTIFLESESVRLTSRTQMTLYDQIILGTLKIQLTT